METKRCTLTPRNKYKIGLANRTTYLEGWLQLQSLLEGDIFTCTILNEERGPKSVLVKFIPSCSSLYLIPLSLSMERCVNNKADHKYNGGQSLWSLSQVQMVGTSRKIKEGLRGKNAWEQLTENEANSDHCLNICHGKWPWKVAQLVSRNQSIILTWQYWLQAFMQQERHTLSTVSILDSWLLSRYAKLKFQKGGSLFVIDALSDFAGLRRWKTCGVLSAITKVDKELNDLVLENANDVTFELYQYLYYSYIVAQRTDIKKLYFKFSQLTGINSKCNNDTYNTKHPFKFIIRHNRDRRQEHPILRRQNACDHNDPSPHAMMSIAGFHEFLKITRRKTEISPAMIKKIIRQYDFQTNSSSEEPFLSLPGFAHYLMTQESLPMVSTSVPKIDTSHPLSSYFISSSHNTYLTGHQLHGDSSVTMYANILKTGCRCVEIDCWDGEDGEPIVYHGHTLTTKLKFEQVVNTIDEYAFVSSPFPLILSIENHCSVSQQEKMAFYMKKSFGDSLLTDYINNDPNPSTLPILEQLKNKILIKNRKSAMLATTDVPLSRSSPKLVKNSDYQHGIKSFMSSPTLHSPLVVSKSCTPYNVATDLVISSAPNTPSCYPSCSPQKPFNFPAAHLDKTENLSRRNTFTDGNKSAIRRPSLESSHSSSLSVSSMPPMSTILEDDINNDSCANNDIINDDAFEAIVETDDVLSIDNNRFVMESSLNYTNKRKTSNIPSNLDTIVTMMNSNGFNTTETNYNSNKGETCVLQQGDVPHNDCGSSCTEYCQHSVIDLTSHVCASRTTSSDSNQSQCSNSWQVAPKITQIPTDTSRLSNNAMMLMGENESLESYNHFYEDAENDNITPTTVVDDVISLSVSGSSCIPPNYRSVKSHSICSTDLLTDSCYSESVAELIIDHDSTILTCQDKDKLSKTTEFDNTDIPNGQEPLTLNTNDSKNDKYCTESDNDTSPSSLISLFSILASLDEAEGSDASFTHTPERTLGKPLRSLSCSAVPSKNSSSMYSNVLNLPAGPANVLRRSFRKSHSFSSQTRKKMSSGRRKGSMGQAYGSKWDIAPICIDTVESSYSKREIALQLSDLIIYTEAKKYCGFKDPRTLAMKCTEMFSLNESCAKKAVKKTPNDVLRFTENHLLRVYPSATRFNSSNFNPALFWMTGCQMVALNYQTADSWMHYYTTFFSQHNNCGYVLKPPELRPNTLRTEQRTNSQMRLTILSAQCCNFTASMSSVSLEIEVIGVPRECTRYKLTSTRIEGTCVYWNHTDSSIVINTSMTSLTALKFILTFDKDTIPLSEIILWEYLNHGYQHIYFMDDSMLTDNLPISLFFIVQFNDSYHDDMLDETILHEPATDVCHGAVEVMMSSSVKDNSDSFPSNINVYYNELPELHVELLSSIAVSTMIAKDILINAVGCLSYKEVASVCPKMSNPIDKDMVVTFFQLYLAKESPSNGKIEKICLIPNEDWINQHFCNQENHCLLVSLKPCTVSTELAPVVGLEYVLSVENNVQICQERRVSVEAKKLLTTRDNMMPHNKHTPIEANLLYSTTIRESDRINSFSSCYRPSVTGNVWAQNQPILRKQRMDSTSSVYEITHYDYNPVFVNSQFTDIVAARRQRDRNNTFAHKLRRKLFGEKRSKSSPLNSIIEQSSTEETIMSNRLPALLYKNEVSNRIIYRHPRLRFSTGLPLDDKES